MTSPASSENAKASNRIHAADGGGGGVIDVVSPSVPCGGDNPVPDPPVTSAGNNHGRTALDAIEQVSSAMDNDPNRLDEPNQSITAAKASEEKIGNPSQRPQKNVTVIPIPRLDDSNRTRQPLADDVDKTQLEVTKGPISVDTTKKVVDRNSAKLLTENVAVPVSGRDEHEEANRNQQAAPVVVVGSTSTKTVKKNNPPRRIEHDDHDPKRPSKRGAGQSSRTIDRRQSTSGSRGGHRQKGRVMQQPVGMKKNESVSWESGTDDADNRARQAHATSVQQPHYYTYEQLQPLAPTPLAPPPPQYHLPQQHPPPPQQAWGMVSPQFTHHSPQSGGWMHHHQQAATTHQRTEWNQRPIHALDANPNARSAIGREDGNTKQRATRGERQVAHRSNLDSRLVGRGSGNGQPDSRNFIDLTDHQEGSVSAGRKQQQVYHRLHHQESVWQPRHAGPERIPNQHTSGRRSKADGDSTPHGQLQHREMVGQDEQLRVMSRERRGRVTSEDAPTAVQEQQWNLQAGGGQLELDWESHFEGLESLIQEVQQMPPHEMQTNSKSIVMLREWRERARILRQSGRLPAQRFTMLQKVERTYEDAKTRFQVFQFQQVQQRQRQASVLGQQLPQHVLPMQCSPQRLLMQTQQTRTRAQDASRRSSSNSGFGVASQIAEAFTPAAAATATAASLAHHSHQTQGRLVKKRFSQRPSHGEKSLPSSTDARERRQMSHESHSQSNEAARGNSFAMKPVSVAPSGYRNADMYRPETDRGNIPERNGIELGSNYPSDARRDDTSTASTCSSRSSDSHKQAPAPVLVMGKKNKVNGTLNEHVNGMPRTVTTTESLLGRQVHSVAAMEGGKSISSVSANQRATNSGRHNNDNRKGTSANTKVKGRSPPKAKRAKQTKRTIYRDRKETAMAGLNLENSREIAKDLHDVFQVFASNRGMLRIKASGQHCGPLETTSFVTDSILKKSDAHESAIESAKIAAVVDAEKAAELTRRRGFIIQQPQPGTEVKGLTKKDILSDVSFGKGTLRIGSGEFIFRGVLEKWFPLYLNPHGEWRQCVVSLVREELKKLECRLLQKKPADAPASKASVAKNYVVMTKDQEVEKIKQGFNYLFSLYGDIAQWIHTAYKQQQNSLPETCCPHFKGSPHVGMKIFQKTLGMFAREYSRAESLSDRHLKADRMVEQLIEQGCYVTRNAQVGKSSTPLMYAALRILCAAALERACGFDSVSKFLPPKSVTVDANTQTASPESRKIPSDAHKDKGSLGNGIASKKASSKASIKKTASRVQSDVEVPFHRLMVQESPDDQNPSDTTPRGESRQDASASRVAKAKPRSGADKKEDNDETIDSRDSTVLPRMEAVALLRSVETRRQEEGKPVERPFVEKGNELAVQKSPELPIEDEHRVIEQCAPMDVLAGRMANMPVSALRNSMKSSDNIGDEVFKSAITAFMPRYVEADKKHLRSALVREVTNYLLSLGCRFLYVDKKLHQLRVMDQKQVRDKVSFAFRLAITKERPEMAHTATRTKAEHKASDSSLAASHQPSKSTKPATDATASRGNAGVLTGVQQQPRLDLTQLATRASLGLYPGDAAELALAISSTQQQIQALQQMNGLYGLSVGPGTVPNQLGIHGSVQNPLTVPNPLAAHQMVPNPLAAHQMLMQAGGMRTWDVDDGLIQAAIEAQSQSHSRAKLTTDEDADDETTSDDESTTGQQSRGRKQQDFVAPKPSIPKKQKQRKTAGRKRAASVPKSNAPKRKKFHNLADLNRSQRGIVKEAIAKLVSVDRAFEARIHQVIAAGDSIPEEVLKSKESVFAEMFDAHNFACQWEMKNAR